MFETRGEVGNARRLGYKSRILVSLRVLMTITVQSILLGALFVVRVVMGLGCVHWGHQVYPPNAEKCPPYQIGSATKSAVAHPRCDPDNIYVTHNVLQRSEEYLISF